MISGLIKSDITSGFKPNGEPNLLFKKGDYVAGIGTERFIFNKKMYGIMFKPTVPNAYVENVDGLVFIPIEAISLVSRSHSTPPAPNSNTNLIQEFQFIKPFSTTYTVGGINPLRTYSKKSMELIKGVRVGDFVRVSLPLPFGVGLQGAQDSILIPMSYLSLPQNPTGTQAQTQTQGSPNAQKGEAPKADQVKTDEDVKTDSSTAKLNLSDDKILGLPKNTVILLALVVGGFLAYKYFKK